MAHIVHNVLQGSAGMTTFQFLVLFGLPIVIGVAGVVAAVCFHRLHGRAPGQVK